MSGDISNIVAVRPLVREIKDAQKVKESVNQEASVNSVTTGDDENSKLKPKVSSLAEVRKLAEEGNKILENVQRNLQFKVDDSTKQVVMSIVDKRTGEVIKQIPSEDVLSLARRMQDLNGESGIVQDRA